MYEEYICLEERSIFNVLTLKYITEPLSFRRYPTFLTLLWVPSDYVAGSGGGPSKWRIVPSLTIITESFLQNSSYTHPPSKWPLISPPHSILSGPAWSFLSLVCLDVYCDDLWRLSCSPLFRRLQTQTKGKSSHLTANKFHLKKTTLFW